MSASIAAHSVVSLVTPVYVVSYCSSLRSPWATTCSRRSPASVTARSMVSM